MSELTVEANVQVMVKLDKGELIPPLLGNLTVASDKLKSKHAIAVESDVKNFLISKLNGVEYMNGGFVAGTVMLDDSSLKIPLSSKLKKAGEFVVLKGDIEGNVTVAPANDPNVGPDNNIPIKATITLTPTQTKLKAMA